MKKYIIFDLDGTLIDSENVIEKRFLEEVFNYKKEYLDTARYYRNNTSGLAYKDFLALIYKEPQDRDFMEEKIKHILEESASGFALFPGVKQTIENLSKNYILFVSTGSYTSSAVDILKNLGLYNFFAHIQGSEVIPKSPEHIHIFKEITMDPDFESYTLSIGDGETEKQVAHTCNIDFIQVGPKAQHLHTLPSVSHLEDYLHHFTNTKIVEVDEQNFML